MKRLSTRTKRYLKLSRSRMHGNRFHVKVNRPKTFATAEGANKYAADVMKLEENAYTLEPAKKNKKFKIVARN